MADRCEEHPWGTCDGCGVDLGGVCCYSPHSFDDYDSLCDTCFKSMKDEADERYRQRRAAEKDRARKRRQ